MITVVKCVQCGSESSLCIEFKFDVEVKLCPTCHDINRYTWSFHFCSLKCFKSWFKKVSLKGIPCQACHETGYEFGFKSNGKCPVCDGVSFVTKSKQIC
jgi:phage FluMu protein Com